MARNTERSTRRSPKDAARRIKKKPCALCRDKVEWVDYKDVNMLRRYMSDRGKIRARRVTGNCAQHQREIALAIKTARELVLLPYMQRTMTERSGGRGRSGRGDRFGGRPPRAEAESGQGAPRAEAAREPGSEVDAGSAAADTGARETDVVPATNGASAANTASAADAATATTTPEPVEAATADTDR
jgi:small subunit ribosomal protein S18